jgi:hypothetical protein
VSDQRERTPYLKTIYETASAARKRIGFRVESPEDECAIDQCEQMKLRVLLTGYPKDDPISVRDHC